MEIVNFFEKLAGRWFSQRTTHALSTQQSKAGKSNLEVTYLVPEDSEVQALCEGKSTAPLCGLRIEQDSTVEGDTKNIKQTTLLVPLMPESASSDSASGQILRSGGGPGKATVESTYTLEDEVLTIENNDKAANTTERMWFISDNLRMRTGITELESGLRIASFCSEIRLGVKPPAKS